MTKFFSIIFYSTIILCSLFFSPFCVHAADTLYFLHTDHLGSTRVVTDKTGTVVAKYDYYPYGAISYQLPPFAEASGGGPTTNSLPTERLYTSQISDESTDLYFYNARYYNPEIGNFISADAAGGGYLYVEGNPINSTDPTGNQGGGSGGGYDGPWLTTPGTGGQDVPPWVFKYFENGPAWTLPNTIDEALDFYNSTTFHQNMSFADYVTTMDMVSRTAMMGTGGVKYSNIEGEIMGGIGRDLEARGMSSERLAKLPADKREAMMLEAMKRVVARAKEVGGQRAMSVWYYDKVIKKLVKAETTQEAITMLRESGVTVKEGNFFTKFWYRVAGHNRMRVLDSNTIAVNSQYVATDPYSLADLIHEYGAMELTKYSGLRDLTWGQAMEVFNTQVNKWWYR